MRTSLFLSYLGLRFTAEVSFLTFFHNKAHAIKSFQLANAGSYCLSCITKSHSTHFLVLTKHLHPVPSAAFSSTHLFASKYHFHMQNKLHAHFCTTGPSYRELVSQPDIKLQRRGILMGGGGGEWVLISFNPEMSICYP